MNSVVIIGFGALTVLFAMLTTLMAGSWRRGRIGVLLIIACAVTCGWAALIAVDSSIHPVDRGSRIFAEILKAASWLVFVIFALLSSDHGSEKTKARSAPSGLLALAIAAVLCIDGTVVAQVRLPDGLREFWPLIQILANALLAPILVIAAHKNPQWGVAIFVSRQVVFWTATILGIAFYSVLMGVFGYWIYLSGESLGLIAVILFGVSAAMFLLAIVSSGSLRARAKVLVTKHFFRNKYDYRDEWLRLVATLSDLEASSTGKIFIKAMAQVVNSPAGALWVLADHGRSYALAARLDFARAVNDLGPSDSIVEFLRREGWLIDLDEYRRDPAHYQGLDLPPWLGNDSKAWLIVPLFFKHGLLGIILLDRAPGKLHLNFEDRDLLKTIGNHIAVHLAQERSDNLLAESQQFEAYNRLTAFLMHDLNNLIAQQSLIVSNAEKHKRNPDFIDDAMQTIAGSVDRMRRVMEQLKRGETPHPAREVAVERLVLSAIERCSAARPLPNVQFNGVDARVKVDVEQCTMVLAHLIRNAQEATPDDGSVGIVLENGDENVHVAVTDTGCGMSAEFLRDRLFRPFDSTKGSQGMGIGAYQAREFARRMNGDLYVRSSPDEGTTVTLILPVVG